VSELAARAGQEWVKEIDTCDPGAIVPAEKLGAAEPVTVGPRSIVVLRGPVTGNGWTAARLPP